MRNNENVRVKLERHLWPDEIEAKREKRDKKLRKLFVIFSVLAAFSLGFVFGFGNSGKVDISSDINSDSANEKLNDILNIMSNKWYFSKDDSDIVNHVMDRAYYGMTNDSEVDPHTTYMSSEEIKQFTQSINMNFVGIGVQFVNTNDYAIVKKVYKHSPAEEFGVLAGDIIYKVDGVEVKGKSSDEIVDLVQGVSGSKVTIEFIRQGEPVTIDIVRAEINATTYGEMISEDIGYLELYQFGNSTSNEVYDYLTMMSEQGLRKIIIDLRDNGGGYLDSLEHILNYLLPANTVIMQQEYGNGTIDLSKTTKGEFKNIEEIVVLINENTASASEVMTLALKEQRDGVTIVGTTSYGKGTVQVTKSFSDGSAIKYTTSKWLSPSGVWVNNVGIKPDIVVELPTAITTAYGSIEDGLTLDVDSVSDNIKTVQLGLEFLGYKIDRTDGYFNQVTKNAIRNFQKDHDLEETGILDSNVFEAIYSAVSLEWSMNKARDTQYQKALELLNE
ncbi:MAG: S41 family peptidase [Erysipelotrichaceae bacterium]|nr:S41 family peptidase [Erysipelotrichaceae bacterium]